LPARLREQLQRNGTLVVVSQTSPPEPDEPLLERLRQTDTRLDHYIDRYAARAHGMTASAIRALFAVANRPEVVSLAGGMPNITDLPLDVVGSVLNDLVLNDGRRAMQYGSGQGEPAIREAICDVMRLENISAHPDDVMVSVGSQQGLDLLTRIFCNPGDVVICEAPSYVGALGVFRSYQCEVVHVAMDEQGLNPSALADALRALRRAGRTVKFLYTIPNHHNPAGVT
jgi:2-aminoadipate transaminase